MELYCPKTGEKTEWPKKTVEAGKGCFYSVYTCKDCEEKCIVDAVFIRHMTPEAVRDCEITASNLADMVGKMQNLVVNKPMCHGTVA